MQEELKRKERNLFLYYDRKRKPISQVLSVTFGVCANAEFYGLPVSPLGDFTNRRGSGQSIVKSQREYTIFVFL